MPSTWSRNLRLERIATGEQPGTWGGTTNNNLDLIDDAIDGVAHITLSSVSYKIDTINGGASEGRSKVLHFVGTLSADCRVTISPLDAEKHYVIINETNGPGGPGTPGSNVIVSQGSGASYTLAPGYANLVYCDGLGDTAGVYAAFNNLQVNNLKIDGAVAAAAGLAVTGNISATGNLSVAGALGAGASTLNSLTVGGATTLTGAATLSSSLSVAGALTATGPVQFDLASSATGDVYYRSSGGPLARLGIGGAGQYLRVSGGVPAWQTVDTSITMGSTPVTGSAAGRIHFTNNGVMSDSANLLFNPANGALGCSGGFSAGGGIDATGAISAGTSISAGGAITAGGTLTAGNGLIDFTNAFRTQITASGGNWTFAKEGTGAIWFENNGMEMLRLHHTKHCMFACPPAPGDLNYAVVDALMKNSQAGLMWDEARSILVIRVKGSQGAVGQVKLAIVAG